MRSLLPLAQLTIAGLCAQTHPLEAIVDAARANPPALKNLLATSFPNLKNQGTALVWGQDFLFVAETAKQPAVSVDAQGIQEALRKVYGATALADELSGSKAAAAKAGK